MTGALIICVDLQALLTQFDDALGVMYAALREAKVRVVGETGDSESDGRRDGAVPGPGQRDGVGHDGSVDRGAVHTGSTEGWVEAAECIGFCEAIVGMYENELQLKHRVGTTARQTAIRGGGEALVALQVAYDAQPFLDHHFIREERLRLSLS